MIKDSVVSTILHDQFRTVRFLTGTCYKKYKLLQLGRRCLEEGGSHGYRVFMVTGEGGGGFGRL